MVTVCFKESMFVSNATKAIMVVTRSMLRAQTQNINTPQKVANLNTSVISRASYKVEHLPLEGKFIMKLDAKTQAFITYSQNGDVYTLNHTRVPELFKGKGIAQVLAEKTFDIIIAKKGKLKLTCDYLVKFAKQNDSKYKKHVV